jgi:hypothetical protein
VYFLAIEITRRRLASVISRLARRALASPVDICLLMSLSSLSGMPMRFCRSIRLLLLFEDVRRGAHQLRGVGLARLHLVLEPLHVGFVAGEHLDEVGARHVRLVHAQMQDLAFVAAHRFDHAAHRVAQALDGLGGEADVHQFVGDLLLQAQVALVLRTLLGQGRLQLSEQAHG